MFLATTTANSGVMSTGITEVEKPETAVVEEKTEKKK